MKLELYDEIALALDTRKKNGESVFDQNNLEVKVAGTFAGDKFIVCLLYTAPSPRDRG